MFEITFKEIEL